MAAKSEPSQTDRTKILNFNVGILGHVDSGKTSLAKALSSVSSTAAFDKNPQSQERGITLDLGFSSFTLPIPDCLKDTGYESVQFTLVDCPGHASLIKTIIGGAQIIDLMLLVIDVTKGIQTQTAECLLIGEITCNHMIIVLNKIDLLDSSKKDSLITKMTKKISKTMETTKFNGATIVPVSAKPDDGDNGSIGIDNLLKVLSESLFVPHRSAAGPFLYSVDHCFAIRGQGTVMTGTVLSGCVQINDNIEIPLLKVTKKVKSMQMFHQPVQRAIQGDRVAICITQFDPKSIERCLVCTPGSLPTVYAGVFDVTKVRYYKMTCPTGGKFHITIGHDTVMAKTSFFGTDVQSPPGVFDYSLDYLYQNELHGMSEKPSPSDGAGPIDGGGDGSRPLQHQYALVEFERPVIISPHCVAIGSKLDADAYSNICRIAFHGTLLELTTDKDYNHSFLPRLKIYKMKSKEGIVERIQDERTVIGKGLFKRETKIQSFVGLKASLSTGEEGVIEGAFGTAGKFRLNIPNGLKDETMAAYKGGDKKKSKPAADATSGPTESIKIFLNFKRFVFDPNKRMNQ